VWAGKEKVEGKLKDDFQINFEKMKNPPQNIFCNERILPHKNLILFYYKLTTPRLTIFFPFLIAGL